MKWRPSRAGKSNPRRTNKVNAATTAHVQYNFQQHQMVCDHCGVTEPVPDELEAAELTAMAVIFMADHVGCPPASAETKGHARAGFDKIVKNNGLTSTI